MVKTGRELAHIYDLFVAPTWRDCFDRIFNENLRLPEKGRVLDVNCGTGGHAIEMSAALSTRGDVTGVDESVEMIGLAQAKAHAAKIENVKFRVGRGEALEFPDGEFNTVIGDASFISTSQLKTQASELVRVAKPGALIVFYTVTRGSFDEFYSIFWEALYDCSLAEETLASLERLINDQPTVSDAATILRSAGIAGVKNYQKKETFFYETAEQFFISPLIENYLLYQWLSILPSGCAKPVRTVLEKIIDRERGNYSFDISIKATLFAGEKN